MEKLNLEETRKYQLEMLEYLDKLCEKHGIVYSLSCGTMLGAVRHHGFIPWDDDVDIMLEYTQYVRLLKALEEDGKYPLVQPGDKNYRLYFAKITHPDTCSVVSNYGGYIPNPQSGVYIDIFPVVTYTDEEKDMKIYDFYHNCRYVSAEDGLFAFVKKAGLLHCLLRAPFVVFCKLFGMRYWNKKFHKHIEKNLASAKLGGIYEFRMKGSVDISCFKETCKLDFEHLKLSCYSEYDKILTALYGDYMQPPPVEQRVVRHSGEVMYRK